MWGQGRMAAAERVESDKKQSDENIKELKTLIQHFRKSVLELSEQDQNKQNVYQVGIQMFPLSQLESE